MNPENLLDLIHGKTRLLRVELTNPRVSLRRFPSQRSATACYVFFLQCNRCNGHSPIIILEAYTSLYFQQIINSRRPCSVLIIKRKHLLVHVLLTLMIVQPRTNSLGIFAPTVRVNLLHKPALPFRN